MQLEDKFLFSCDHSVCMCVCVCVIPGEEDFLGGYSPTLRKPHKKERMGLDGGHSLWGTPSSRAQPWSLFQDTERELGSILGEQWEGQDCRSPGLKGPWNDRHGDAEAGEGKR